MGYHALVFGASGILGWGVVNQLLNSYPESGVYSRVTALTNRPLTVEEAGWPQPGRETPAFRLVSGIDFTRGTLEECKDVLRQKVPNVETVDHVFYFAYQSDPHFPTESEINLAMLKRGFGAVESLAPNIKYVILPTGTKGYGILLQPRPFQAPFDESMGDIPRPARDELFYYVLRDELNRMQRGKSWKWAEVRCDIVIGFTPHPNPHNMVRVYANYLSLYKHMHERGHPAAASRRVAFPFAHMYAVRNNEVAQDTFGRFSIHLCCLQGSSSSPASGELYNIGDEDAPRTYAERWPLICSLFGLEGVAPSSSSSSDADDDNAGAHVPTEFVAQHAAEAKALLAEKGVALQAGVAASDARFKGRMSGMAGFDRHMRLAKARAAGFGEQVPLATSWQTAVRRYARARKAYLGEEAEAAAAAEEVEPRVRARL